MVFWEKKTKQNKSLKMQKSHTPNEEELAKADTTDARQRGKQRLQSQAHLRYGLLRSHAMSGA